MNEKENEIQNEKRPDTDLLQSCYSNIQTGINSIDYLIPEAVSTDFISLISEQKTKFKQLEDKCKTLSEKFKLEIKENSCLTNLKMWLNIKFASFGVDDSQRFAELMIMGNFFGTIDLIKALADCSKAKPEILQLARDTKSLEEECINLLVPYLERTKK